MTLDALILIVNTVFLVVATLITIWIGRLGAQHSFYQGIIETTEAIKWKIVKAILFLIALGLSSILFNLVVGFFE